MNITLISSRGADPIRFEKVSKAYSHLVTLPDTDLGACAYAITPDFVYCAGEHAYEPMNPSYQTLKLPQPQYPDLHRYMVDSEM
jgi:hypothetical protein